MRARRTAFLVALLCLAPLCTRAGGSTGVHPADPGSGRPRVGLVLGGGGARGGAHIGVIETLEKLRVPVDFIAGTSIGAIIGGLYAAGLSPEEMRAEIEHIDWDRAFNDKPVRWRLPYRRKEDEWFNYTALELGVSKSGVRAPAGIVSGRNLLFLFNSLTLQTADIKDFDHLPIPFRAVATDLSTGDAVIMDHGSLAAAMRASMAIPGVLTPTAWNGHLLIDGGFSENLPVQTVREMGADIVIAVDVSPVFAEGHPQDWSLIEISKQTIGMATTDNTRRSRASLTTGDVLIEPNLDNIDLLSFDRMPEAIEDGRESAQRLSEALSRLSVSEDVYADYVKRQRRKMVGSHAFVVDEVEIEPLRRVPQKMVSRLLDISPGDSVNLKTLERDLDRVYQIGEFENVGFELRREDDVSRLTIDAKEKDTGPNYLRFGMRIRSAPDGTTDFSLLFYHRWAFVNRLGAEWLNRLHMGDTGLFMSEFYQPVVPAGWLFVASRVEGYKENLHLFYPDGRRDVMQHAMAFVQCDAGIQVSNLMQLRGGIRLGERRTEFRSLAGSEEHSGVGEWFAQFDIDGLDEVGFPTVGAGLRVEARLSRSDIHAEENYDRLWGRAALAGSLGRSTLLVTGEAGTDFRTGLPVYDSFRAGGFLRLSGLDNGERAGGAMALASLALYRRVGTAPEVLGEGIYTGVSAETGNAWPTAADADISDLLISGSVFFGLQTVVGPFYVAWGVAEGGSSAFHLILDTLFPGTRFF